MIVEIKKSAAKDITKISEPFKTQIKQKIKQLSQYPDIANIKKLTNYNPTHRLRVGNYRVLFDVEDDVIVVSRIKHRKDVYWCSKTKETRTQAIDNTTATIAQRFGLSSEAVMIGVGGATVGVGAYKLAKMTPLLNKSKQSKRVSNDKHNNANGNNFQKPHDNTPFDELSNYTKKWQEKEKHGIITPYLFFYQCVLTCIGTPSGAG